jgi:hypothetical protein
VRLHVLPLTVAVSIAAIVHAGAVRTFFAQDDFTFLSRAAGLAPPEYFFRPISSWLAFKAGYAAFRLDPVPYDVMNLVVHLLNVALVYILAARLGATPSVAAGAAMLFGLSPATFTPLHWATGIAESMAATFLLLATLCALTRGSVRMLWLSAFLALLAMLSKETAAVWGVLFVLMRSRVIPARLTMGQVLPVLAATIGFLTLFLLTGWQHPSTSGAYALTASPAFLVRNLLTYVRWAVDLMVSVPDAVAAADPGAWRIAAPVLLVAGVLLWNRRNATELPVALVGLGWWLVFLLPVLPLAHHTYAYYLYIPSIGGALLVAFLGAAFARRRPARISRALALASIVAYVLVQSRNLSARESATWNALPIDRTIRDATLVQHCLAGLRQANLPAGSSIQFVNPVPAPRFDLTTGAPTAADDTAQRASYYPLEGALRGGETLKLFFPHLVYGGFSSKVPLSPQIDCFYFEQRGWLRYWGRGREALTRQTELLASLRK